MKKQKLNLNTLKVKSFVTAKHHIYGGGTHQSGMDQCDPTASRPVLACNDGTQPGGGNTGGDPVASAVCTQQSCACPTRPGDCATLPILVCTG